MRYRIATFLFKLKEDFSKITPSLFTLKEGSTSHPDPLSSGAREETALLGARNRFALRLAGHQSPRQIVRDGTAWGKGETEDYYYYLSIRFSYIFIFLP